MCQSVFVSQLDCSEALHRGSWHRRRKPAPQEKRHRQGGQTLRRLKAALSTARKMEVGREGESNIIGGATEDIFEEQEGNKRIAAGAQADEKRGKKRSGCKR